MPFKFPYTNFQELNLDWIIKKVKDLSKQIEDDSSIVSEYIDRLIAVEDKADSAESTATAADARATGANNTANSALTLATQAKQTAEIADLSTTLLGLKIGDLSSLYTTAKDTIVNAINEVWSIFHNATAVTNVTPAGTDPAVTYSNGVFTFDLPEGGDPDAVTHAELDAAVDSLEDSIDDLSEELDNKADVIIDTATGDPATFPDGTATPLKALIVNVEPVQAGTGNPSPTNVRPISGWTGCEIYVASENLFDISSADSGWRLSTTGDAYRDDGYYLSDYISVEVGKTYEKNSPIIDAYHRLCTYDASKTVVRVINDSNEVTIASGEAYVRFCGLLTEENKAFFGTDYNSYSVTWSDEAGNVFGGTLDVASGVLTVTHSMFTLDSSLTAAEIAIVIQTSHTRVYYAPYDNVGKPLTGFVCDTFKDNGTVAGLYYVWHSTSPTAARMFFGVPVSVTTPTEAIAWFTSNPTHIVYELATPTTYQLNPQQVTALAGYNTVGSDAGSVDVAYRADTKGYIDKLIAQVQALALGG